MRRPAMTLALLVAASPALAHSGRLSAGETPAPVFRVEKVAERVYCLFGLGGNVGFLVTDAGVLVVDDQYEDVAPGIVEKIREITDKPIRYLVNTHYHSDHTGGNPVLGKTAEIVAHETVRPRMLEYNETIRRTYPDKVRELEREIASLTEPADPWRAALEKDLGLLRFFLQGATAFDPAAAAPPEITYNGRLTVWLGGEQVQIFHVAPAHTDGDSVVYFKNRKVLHAGDLFFNGMVPFIDWLAGGTSLGYVESIDDVVSRVPPDTKVIPGHGPVAGIPDLRRYRDFIADLRGEVERTVRGGMSKPEAVRAVKMERYPEVKETFRTLGNVVGTVYDEMTQAR